MKKEHIIPFLCLLIVLIVFAIGAINPVYRDDWLLESWLVIISVPILVLTYKKFKFSNNSYILIAIFFILHIIGSHYTYSEVPFGFWLSELFNFSRNHYDRLLHLLWGILLYLPALEIYQKVSKSKTKFLFYYLMPASILITLGVFYEVIEWLAAVIVAPEVGTAFLGTQGDQWDVYKDLFLKTIGSIAMSILFYIKEK